MARRMIPLLALSGALSLPAMADEPAPDAGGHRLYALASAGKVKLLGLADVASLSESTRLELGAQLLPSLRLGLLLDASHQDVTHWEIQAGTGQVTVPGDLMVGLVGPVASWQPRDGTFQPSLRGQGGAAAWLCPVHEENWNSMGEAPGVPTRGLGGWVALGGDLGVEVIADGPVLQLSLDGGYLVAGPLTGPTVSGRIGFSTPF